MTATSLSRRAAAKPKGPRATGLWLLVGFVVAIGILGLALSGLLLAHVEPSATGAAPSVMGRPVETSFGAFTVTNASTTFVPDTQGPPSVAQHNGTNGTDQLQVSIRLVNERVEQGLAYAPAQLRLITDAVSGKGRAPDGSSMKAAILPRGGSIDGRVWFDLPKGSPSNAVGWWLELRQAGGEVVRVALDPAKVVTTPATPGDHHG